MTDPTPDLARAVETLRERDARLNAWLATVAPGDIVTVRLNGTDTLTGKVYEAPDASGCTALYVYTTMLRYGSGYPGSSFEPEPDRATQPTEAALTDEQVDAAVRASAGEPLRVIASREADVWDEGWTTAVSIFTQATTSTPNPYRTQPTAEPRTVETDEREARRILAADLHHAVCDDDGDACCWDGEGTDHDGLCTDQHGIFHEVGVEAFLVDRGWRPTPARADDPTGEPG